MSALLAALLDVVQIAHETQLPHEEMKSGSSTSVIVVIAVVVASLALAGGLIWVKKRSDA